MRKHGVRVPPGFKVKKPAKDKPAKKFQKLDRHKEFIRVWQGCRTLKEFMEKSGFTARAASNEAAAMRRNGVKLRKMPAGKRTVGMERGLIDWEVLRTYAVHEAKAAKLKEKYRGG